jgi:soluble P-type ATPase
MAVIAIDWDHTLMEGKDWIPGAKDALKRLREAGHKVIIHSANEKRWIEHNLANAGIPVDGVWDGKGKPNCDIFVDDKGFRFANWTSDLEPILMLVTDLDNRKWKGSR